MQFKKKRGPNFRFFSWPTTCDLQPVTRDLWPANCDLWPVTLDLRPVTCGLDPPDTNALYIQNSNQRASRLTATTSFPRIFSAMFNSTSKPFGSQGCSDDKNWLDFWFVDFAAQFSVRCKFSFHEERRLSQIWQRVIFLDQSQFFVSHSNQWDCFILYR